MFKLFRRNKRAEEQRAELLEMFAELKKGRCIIASETEDGTIYMGVGKDIFTRQLEELAKLKGVEL